MLNQAYRPSVPSLDVDMKQVYETFIASRTAATKSNYARDLSLVLGDTVAFPWPRKKGPLLGEDETDRLGVRKSARRQAEFYASLLYRREVPLRYG